MSVEEFRDRDADYLGWVAAHREGYVINIGRSGQGYARLHRATCGTITSTGPYIKICSTAVTELDRWALQRTGTFPERCGTCQPPGAPALGKHAGAAEPATSIRADHESQPLTPAAGPGWEIEGPGDDRRLWLWATRYIPFERLSPAQLAARDALRRRVRSLAAPPGEILAASFAGAKPANMDVENLLLYNIDGTASGCFQPGTRHGMRFELAAGPRRGPPSGLHFACSYQYRLISPDSDLSYWRPVRQLARFTGADLGRFPSSKRLEQVWLAIHHATAEIAGSAAGPRNTVRRLPRPRLSAYQDRRSRPRAGQSSHRRCRCRLPGPRRPGVGRRDRRPAGHCHRAASGADRTGVARRRARGPRHTDRLVYPRGTSVQWNPADHLCMAGQVLCQEAPGDRWALSGEIHAIERQHQA